jgi:hypothetical protein
MKRIVVGVIAAVMLVIATAVSAQTTTSSGPFGDIIRNRSTAVPTVPADPTALPPSVVVVTSTFTGEAPEDFVLPQPTLTSIQTSPSRTRLDLVTFRGLLFQSFTANSGR